MDGRLRVLVSSFMTRHRGVVFERGYPALSA
jgi:hypothetical protein